MNDTKPAAHTPMSEPYLGLGWHFGKDQKNLDADYEQDFHAIWNGGNPIVTLRNIYQGYPECGEDLVMQMEPKVAQLIASAPDLLSALEAVSKLDYLQEHNALAAMVKSALLKAKGIQ